MAPSALLPESPILEAPLPQIADPKTKYNDWRADLLEKGFTVVKNAIPKAQAVKYQEKAYAWLKSFDTELDFNKPETWIKENLPVQSKINTFSTYGVAHEKFMWDARMEPGVVDAFTHLWGTDELLVSFDALNITLPNRKDVPRKPAWEHIDQSPFRRGMHCVQGIINLSPSGPDDGGLVIYPGSHKLNDEFFDTQTEKSSWESKDLYMFEREQLEWFTDRGIKPYKVCADVGDLILWDSRTVHYGSEPSEASNQIRTIIYVTYTPARLASEDSLEKKRAIFKAWGGTTHWPHDNIVFINTQTLLDDGTRDPRDRDGPLELPEMSDKLLRFAGAKSY
ncbi:phytanoyl-CoA dioxygenase [Mollisia scopiformis]|uniref:Phytanoyl-CoA dioxygenase n=1 Tax=Mollisia scopiformis TaxID=149040 RepID=A0A132BCK1_MOLSC|nr:phytanoyl-CoA dioxygenase [Mollisia scopiformis]KUJ09729.1 phytanoyl-CoA dioxygenase [Mollisia scopiformis]